jgi:uncharacterized protein
MDIPNDSISILWLLMPLAAFLYASVGHGGASSYIALLTWFAWAPADIRPAALLLNTLVAGLAFFHFRKSCEFPKKLFISLVLFSMPAAYIGSWIELEPQPYRQVLGLLLLFPAMRLLGIFRLREINPVIRRYWMAPVLGMGIGLLSGMIGIGGGILLSPVLLMLGWTDLKQTAAVSALFILLNSIAALAGLNWDNYHWPTELNILIPLSIAGGLCGAFLGSRRFNIRAMRISLGLVLVIAAVKFLT